jgi:hypothetical protein
VEGEGAVEVGVGPCRFKWTSARRVVAAAFLLTMD